nr:hypothetical protein [Lachnospiraceae bacterium]
MGKRLLRKLLGITLAAAMVFTSAVPASAYNGEVDIDLDEAIAAESSVDDIGEEDILDTGAGEPVEQAVQEVKIETDPAEDASIIEEDIEEERVGDEPVISVTEFEDGIIPGTKDGATSVGAYTIVDPTDGNDGTITGNLEFSSGNYPTVPNKLVSWHPFETSGYYAAFKATAAEGYTIGYLFDDYYEDSIIWEKDGIDASGREYLDFAFLRPWIFEGRYLNIAAKTGTDAPVVKRYKLHFTYESGPMDAEFDDSTDLLGKKASDLQGDISFTFDPVPANNEQFDEDEFGDGSYYGGTGTISGTVKYQDEYAGWSSDAEGYYLAFHLKDDRDVLKKDTVEVSDPEDEGVEIYVATSKGEEYVEGKDYGWRKLDTDNIGIWEVTDPENKKIVVKKTLKLDTEARGEFGTPREIIKHPEDKNVYYIYDISGLEVEKVIKFDKNNAGATGEMAMMRDVNDETDSLIANNFSLEGYAFAGWSLTPDGEVQFEDQAEVSEIVAADADAFSHGVLTLYAKYAPINLQVTGLQKASAWPGATEIGTVTVTEPDAENGNVGTISGLLSYSTGNYAPAVGEDVSWHPFETSGYFLGFKAEAEGCEVGYSFSDSGDLNYGPGRNGELTFALTQPWLRNGKNVRIGARNNGKEVIKTYKMEVTGYTGGPLDADAANLPDSSLLGKTAAALQDISAITFDPVPKNDSGMFDAADDDFQEGSKYGGTGTVTGTLKYQESYPEWGNSEGGYYFAYHINADYKYEDGTTLSDQYKTKIYVAT